jgi:hypothetical protein
VQVVAFALEKRMFLNVQYDVEVARRATMCARFSQSGETYARSVFHTGWDLRIYRPLTQHAAFAFALGTRISNHAAGALTGWTSTGHAEESLLIAHLAAASTRPAGDGSFACGRTRAAAILAGLVAADRNVGFRAEDGFLELQRDILPQIGAALGTAAAAGTAAEKIAESEEVSEDLAHVLEHRGIEATRSSTAHGGMSEAVVRGPLVRICQNGVGFAALFEFFFGGGIIRIAVRMKLQRKLAIGTFDFLLPGFAGNPEHFVVVAFYVAGQNGSKSFPVSVS